MKNVSELYNQATKLMEELDQLNRQDKVPADSTEALERLKRRIEVGAFLKAINWVISSAKGDL